MNNNIKGVCAPEADQIWMIKGYCAINVCGHNLNQQMFNTECRQRGTSEDMSLWYRRSEASDAEREQETRQPSHRLTCTHISLTADVSNTHSQCLSATLKKTLGPILASKTIIDCWELQVLYRFLLITFKWTTVAMSRAVSCNSSTAVSYYSP